MESFDYTRCQQQTSDRVARICQEELPLNPLLDELRRIGAEAEEFIAQHQAGDRALIDCGPGCSTCCVVNVSTLLPEGIAIAAYLRRLGAEHLQKVTTRLETLWREVRGLDDDDRLIVRRACAFLDEQGSCGIYPVRPLMCRSVTSTDVESCRAALSAKVLGEDSPVLMHQFQLQLYETLFTGFAEGMEQGGTDGRSFQLSGLVRYLLRQSGSEGDVLSTPRLTWQDLY